MQQITSVYDHAISLVTHHEKTSWYTTIHQDLRQWGTQEGCALDAAPLSAALAAYGLPEQSSQAIVIARLTYWLFLVDASFDEHLHDASQDELDHHLAALLITPQLQLRPHPSSCAERLHNAYRDLVRSGVFRGTHRIERTSSFLNHLLHGMYQEAVWSHAFARSRQVPPFTDYMVTGAATSGIHILAAAITSDHEWTSLESVIQQTAYLMRVANDLSTYDKERAEGKLSAMDIITQSMALPVAGAQRFLLDTMNSLAVPIFALPDTRPTTYFLRRAAAMGIIMAHHGGYAPLLTALRGN